MFQEFKQRLSSLYAFFIKDEKGLQASLKFSLGTFLFEGITTLYMFFLISSKVRFQGFISWDNRWGALIVLYFIFRVFLLHLLLGFFLRIMEWITALKNKKTVYVALIAYAYLFLAIKYPQNFDELPWISLGLKQARLFAIPWIQSLPLVVIAVSWLFSFLRYQRKTLLKITLMLILCAGLGFLSPFQTLEPNWERPPQVTQAVAKSKPNIILVTLDSLRGDFPLENVAGLSDSLQGFLNSSLQFNRVVSPLAQTHAALTSLFTANNPPTTMVRTNLSEKGLESDQSLQASPLQQLKEAGYKIKFVQDTAEYANFNAGNIIDTIQAPEYSVANVVISTFFKNRIIFGLFNNPVGYLILPELKNNTSFFYSYDLPHFTTEVLKEIDNVGQEKDPVVLFIHTCSLHWPAVLPYPYYPQDSFPEKSNTPFSYTSKFRGLSRERLSPAAWDIQANFNKKIYNSAAQMTVKNFLNPVFEQIQETGLDKDSIVVLLSDHGEDLWNSSSRYPQEKYVQHGSSLIFGSSSELAYLRIQLPQKEKKEIPQTVGVIDILPTLMDFAQIPVSTNIEGRSLKGEIDTNKVQQKTYYTETGLWPLSTFYGQFIATPPSTLGPLFKVSSEHAKVFVDPKFLPGIIQQKQRAVYNGKYRLTIYPTQYGFEEFLCDRENDFECTKNLLQTLPEVTARLRVSLYEQVQKDIESGLLKIGACSPFTTNPTPQSMEQIGTYQWQYYFQGLECLRLHHDYGYATRIFDELLLNPETSPALKKTVKQQLRHLCSRGQVFNSFHAPEFLKKILFSEITDNSSPKTISETASCLSVLGLSTEAGTLREKYPSAFQDQKEMDLDGDGEEDSVDLESKRGFNFIWQKYTKAQGAEKDHLRTALQTHPLADYYEADLTIENINHANKENPELANEELEKYFATEINYGLSNYLQKYYYLRLENLSRKDRHLAVADMLQQIVTIKTLPVEYFNFILSILDEAFAKKGVKPGLSELRFSHWNPAPDKHVENLRELEIKTTLQAAEEHFCESQKNPQMCTQVQKWLRNYL